MFSQARAAIQSPYRDFFKLKFVHSLGTCFRHRRRRRRRHRHRHCHHCTVTGRLEILGMLVRFKLSAVPSQTPRCIDFYPRYEGMGHPYPWGGCTCAVAEKEKRLVKSIVNREQTAVCRHGKVQITLSYNHTDTWRIATCTCVIVHLVSKAMRSPRVRGVPGRSSTRLLGNLGHLSSIRHSAVHPTQRRYRDSPVLQSCFPATPGAPW
jgi:hypothetical protein